MSRPRSSKRKDLPDNCYLLKVGKNTYYRYKHPISKAFTSLGRERSTALRTARILNARLLSTPSAEELAAKVMAPRMEISRYIERFRDIILPARRSRRGKPLSPKTLEEYKRQLARIDSDLGATDIARISRRDISVFLERFPPFYRNRVRGLLLDLFAHAVAEGHRDDNPVAGTLKSDEVVSRRRLTLAEYEKIHANADPWFQLALDLALVTLQRREDLASLTTEQLRDGYMYIEQNKTGRRIRIGYANTRLEPLLTPFVAAAALAAASPLETEAQRSTRRILRKPKGRGRRKVTPEMLTREFSRLWAEQIGPRRPGDPTFHEIRALGARLYEDRGIDPQLLLGHADPRMTRWYLDRHKVEWAEIDLP